MTGCITLMYFLSSDSPLAFEFIPEISTAKDMHEKCLNSSVVMRFYEEKS